MSFIPTKIAAVAVVAALAVSGGVYAQSALNTDPAAVEAGAYTLETSHARVVFATSHMGFSTWYGDFSGATGTLTLDPKDPAASKLEVSIPAASVTTTNAKLDAELKSADWFDAATYPTITFKSTKVTPTGPGAAKVEGDLTFHGVTKPVTLDARFKASGTNPLSKAYTVGFEVTGQLKRSDFGVKTYVPLIGDEVSLMISAPFEKAK
ncbi:MAG: YceI family protein [Phenylobacterium sp.]|uniref:YceI family protein n=1 Tax=Phenylobacterium sp. TaxID=1871053 RepID=UPI00391A0651